MLSLVQHYIQFIFRPPSTEVLPSGASTVENFYLKCALWSLLFILLNGIVPYVSKRYLTSWYESLTPRKRSEMPAYVVCLVHHFLLVPVAWWHIIQDINRSSDHDYSLTESWVSPISVGYLVGDTIGYALPEAFHGRFDYIIHHVLTLWLVWSTIFASGQMLRFVPHLLICDSTNIFFNIAWLIRSTTWKDAAIVTTMEIIFALLFLVCRVINMPLVFAAVVYHGLDKTIGWSSFTFLPISLLQWYWFSKIAGTTVTRLYSKKTKDV